MYICQLELFIKNIIKVRYMSIVIVIQILSELHDKYPVNILIPGEPVIFSKT